MNSPYIGWQVVCGSSTCDGSTKPGEIAVLELEIAGAETAGPTVSVAPGSLGAAGGWARGTWTIAFSADGPSGACQLAASLGGASVSQPLNEPQSQTMWHQCSAGSFSQSLNTAAIGSGASTPLVMWARGAAYGYSARHYLSDTVTKYVNIDNNPHCEPRTGRAQATEHWRGRSRIGAAVGELDHGASTAMAEFRAAAPPAGPTVTSARRSPTTSAGSTAFRRKRVAPRRDRRFSRAGQCPFVGRPCLARKARIPQRSLLSARRRGAHD